MVLRVALEVIDVDGRKSRDEELQLLLVEDRDEPLRNDVVKTIEESVDLLTNCAYISWKWG